MLTGTWAEILVTQSGARDKSKEAMYTWALCHDLVDHGHATAADPFTSKLVALPPALFRCIIASTYTHNLQLFYDRAWVIENARRKAAAKYPNAKCNKLPIGKSKTPNSNTCLIL